MRLAGSVLRRCALALMLMGVTAPLAMAPVPAAASEIKYVVNNQPVTSYDIQRRAAFLRLQNRKGNLQQLASEEMIDQAVRAAEIARMGIRISDDQVAAAYERFAGSNKMKSSQMDQVLNQSGVSKAHFRDFIRAQMGWSQVLSSRARGPGGTMSEQDVVQRMLQQGGEKPSATEYMLQQVVFVVPPAERRAKLATRKREAEAMRQRFRGCESTREFARGLIDVTVRDLGRTLAPELPSEWADHIKKANPGTATAVRETERGVEFIGICSAREVSDDRVAQMVFQSEKSGGGGADEDMSKKLTKELRDKAQIVRR
jgi:peptidyl-prolyl cis-trans isomerase SurA